MHTEHVVDTPCGPVVSRASGGILRARGIRYARAARFAAPERPARWELPFDAMQESPACPQPASPLLERMFGDGYRAACQDEDCQRLSVTAPYDAGVGPFPVMVWIHGGSYTSGSGDARLTDPTALVDEQQVIVVTVTYRLGILGYLGAGEARPANLGLYDQIAALRWVQENIAAFGGDPGNVTVFGQSAGADAVAHLMALPEAPRLFRRAIVQSAPPRSPKRQRIAAAMAAATAGLSPEAPIAEVLAAQRDASQAAAAFGLAASMPFGVQYGHSPLPSWQECRRGWARNAREIDLLIGHTTQEARFFLPAVAWAERAARLPLIGNAAGRVLPRMLTSVVYGKPAKEFARAHRAAGGAGYLYRIGWAAGKGPFGAAHTIDLPLLFGDAEAWATTGLLQGVKPLEIRAAAVTTRRIWAEFARTGLISARRIPRLIDVTRLDPASAT